MTTNKYLEKAREILNLDDPSLFRLLSRAEAEAQMERIAAPLAQALAEVERETRFDERDRCNQEWVERTEHREQEYKMMRAQLDETLSRFADYLKHTYIPPVRGETHWCKWPPLPAEVE